MRVVFLGKAARLPLGLELAAQNGVDWPKKLRREARRARRNFILFV
jgi:hypothetical protein